MSRRRIHGVCFAIGAALGAAACVDNLQVYESVTAPDSAHVATYYRVYGGSAVSHNYMRVSVRPSREPLAPDVYVFQMTHGCRVRLRWDGPRRLTIAYPRGTTLLPARGRVDSIAIAIVPGDPRPDDPMTC